jgi:hypothetical protein
MHGHYLDIQVVTVISNSSKTNWEWMETHLLCATWVWPPFPSCILFRYSHSSPVHLRQTDSEWTLTCYVIHQYNHHGTVAFYSDTHTHLQFVLDELTVSGYSLAMCYLSMTTMTLLDWSKMNWQCGHSLDIWWSPLQLIIDMLYSCASPVRLRRTANAWTLPGHSGTHTHLQFV